MIATDTAGDVTVLRLQHGKVNALDLELLEEFSATLTTLRGSARAVVLTGNGRVFSAGADLTRVLDGGPDYVSRWIPALSTAFVDLFAFPHPVVAAIDGAAIAGGCILAAACDHRVMADGRAVIGATELMVGVPFPVAALEVIRHACGARTGNLVLRARLLDPVEALAVGLVDEVVAADDVQERALAVATELAALPGEAFAMAKRQLRADVLARIERDSPRLDGDAAALWAAPETSARIAAQLERLRTVRRREL